MNIEDKQKLLIELKDRVIVLTKELHEDTEAYRKKASLEFVRSQTWEYTGRDATSVSFKCSGIFKQPYELEGTQLYGQCLVIDGSLVEIAEKLRVYKIRVPVWVKLIFTIKDIEDIEKMLQEHSGM